mmetsp:Transcript_42876/g.135075  ORF Transcript_42876/g.135075 Transcript_42876/m.135075 type:complete len:304 (+) Transcript_42876:60-971(+)
MRARASQGKRKFGNKAREKTGQGGEKPVKATDIETEYKIVEMHHAYHFMLPSVISSSSNSSERSSETLFALLLLADQLLCQRIRHGIVATELHAEGGPAFRKSAQIGDVAEHVGEGDLAIEHLQIDAIPDIVHDSAARLNVALDGCLVVLRCHNLHRHHRLQNYGLALHASLFECCLTGNLEGEARGVHWVGRTIEQPHLGVHNGIVGLDASAHGRLNSLDDGRNELLRDRGLTNLVHELKSLTWVRLDDNRDLGILSGATRLLLVRVPELLRRGDCLSVRHLRSPGLAFHLELTLHSVDDNL